MMKAEIQSGIDERQRLGACLLGFVEPASLAHEAVLDMEMDLLRRGWPVGQSIGALSEMKKRFDLGRPASREVITILQARGLLDVRRGPGGGHFVSAPALEDVAGAVLMYLALTGETQACIEQFRLLVWRMTVNLAIRQGIVLTAGAKASPWGFAADLATQTGSRTSGLLARRGRGRLRICRGGDALDNDPALELAIRQGDLAATFHRLDDLTCQVKQDAPLVALEVAVRSFSLSGHKSAMALAARMARELSGSQGTQEAEWETAERLGYTDGVVRQARRILQDFGIVRCRQGRKGAELTPPADPTGVIRMLAPALVASASSAQDVQGSISYLISTAPVLAARRVKAATSPLPPLGPIGSASDSDALEAVTLENMLLERSGNPLLGIAVRSLGLAYIMVTDSLTPPDRSYVIAINRRILQAVEAGDVGTAGVLAGVKLETMLQPTEAPPDAAAR